MDEILERMEVLLQRHDESSRCIEALNFKGWLTSFAGKLERGKWMQDSPSYNTLRHHDS